MRWRAFRVSLGLSVAALLLGALAVSADEFGTNDSDTGARADSIIHTYCFVSAFEANLRDNANWVMQNSIDRDTQMVDSLETCSGNTDVEFFDGNLPDPTRGLYQCQTLLVVDVCNHAHVTVDPAQINIGDFDEEDLSKTICHEVGHSVGLTHGGLSDCMRNGGIPDPAETWRVYDPHHKQHINDAY